MNDKLNINGQPYSIHSGSWANIEQVFMCHYPFLSSGGGRTDYSTNTSLGAYYYQGFCCTPNGFALVRLAPTDTSAKSVSTDISQIIEFNSDGTFRSIWAPTPNIGHGNGMCYYDGYLYVDVGSTVNKINYTSHETEKVITMYGSCPAIDKQNGVIYSAARSGSSYTLYKYDISADEVTSIPIASDCPDIYNGSFYKNGIFYGITYNNDFIMIDVATGKFLGGVSTSSVDTTGIYLYELEDADCDENGTVYIMSQQPGFTTRGFDVSGVEYRIRNVGFYIGKLYLNGGASVDPNATKPIRIHRSGIYVKSPTSDSEAKNAVLQTGYSDTPFYSFAALSFLTKDVREIRADYYTTLYFADIYQPCDVVPYGYIKNLNISTNHPFAIKGWKGYLEGETINITNFGISLVWCDVDNVDLTCTKNCCMGLVQYGRAEIIQKSASYKTTMMVKACIINGGNVLPVGLDNNTQSGNCVTHYMKYTNQTFSQGDSAVVYIPNVGGNRGTRISLSGPNNYVIYRRYSDTKLQGIDGSSITLTEAYSGTANYFLKFTAPFDITAIEAF